MSQFKMFFKLGSGNREFFPLILSTMKTHRDVEKEFANKLTAYLNESEYSYADTGANPVKYLEKNFFSILLLSILKKMDVNKKYIIKYGIIMHCLRGIITCTDNILDSESKGSVFLKDIKSHSLSNIMLNIVIQNILNDTISEISDNRAQASEINTIITKAIYSIAKGENFRYLEDSIEKPEIIIEEVHKKIGGELLELALIAPAIVEGNTWLIKAKKGIFEIGVALQMLDDVYDFKEDCELKKKNLLFSHIAHKEKLSVKKLLKLSEKPEFYNSSRYTSSYTELICSSVNTALSGFQILHEAGYPINREEGELIIEFMFNVRGLEDGWEVYLKTKS